MRALRTIVLAAALAAIVTSAARAADGPAAVRVLACVPWQEGEGGAVTYRARMRAVPGTVRMAMRIRLLEKAGNRGYRRVDADELGVWRDSRPRAETFVWEQSVRGLRRGAVYRAVVHYRWYGAAGDLLRSERRRSARCGQKGALPNLRVASIDTRPGEVEQTAEYRVKVVNRGSSTARRVGVLLRVDGKLVDEIELIDGLRSGEARAVTFTGPVCRRRLLVVVDPRKLVEESREGDNTRAPACL